MSCECYQIGGPFIDVDPNCPTHGPGGSLEREEELQDQIRELRATVKKLEARIAELERGSSTDS